MKGKTEQNIAAVGRDDDGECSTCGKSVFRPLLAPRPRETLDASRT